MTWPSWQQMRQLGYDTAQGFLISRPVPTAELAAWARTHRRPGMLQSVAT